MTAEKLWACDAQEYLLLSLFLLVFTSGVQSFPADYVSLFGYFRALISRVGGLGVKSHCLKQ